MIFISFKANAPWLWWIVLQNVWQQKKQCKVLGNNAGTNTGNFHQRNPPTRKKKMFLKGVWSLFFHKVPGLKDSNTGVFHVNIAKFLRTTFYRTPTAFGFEFARNWNSDSAEWNHAVLPTTTPQRNKMETTLLICLQRY